MLINEITSLRIKNCSQKLFRRAIETSPLSSHAGILYFSSKGILNPINLHNPEQLEVYSGQCELEGVMPFTCMTYEYDQEKDLFLPALKQPNLIVSDKLGLEKVVQAFSSGGRFSLQVFKFKSGFDSKSKSFTEPLETFIDKNYQHLLDNNYELASGTLVLKAEPPKCSLGNLELNFTNKDIILEFGSYSPTQDKDSLKANNWFKKLAA